MGLIFYFGTYEYAPFICTKMKNRSHLYQNYSTRFLIGRIVSQRIITLIFYCSNKKIKQQNSDRRSRANVLRACQQRVGLYTKVRAGYRRDARVARPPATLNHELKVVGLIVLGQLNILGTNAIDFLFWYKWD